MAKVKKQHFVNGLISEMRDDAVAPNKKLAAKAIAESKKAGATGKSVFAKLSAKRAYKLVSL